MYQFYFSSNNRKLLLTELSSDYTERTAVLLNSEWPKNLHQRCQTLNALSTATTTTSEDRKRLQLPVSLIIVDVDADSVIGHASIISIATRSERTTRSVLNLPFLQSLVIDKSLRGLGLGKRLVLESETYFAAYGRQQQQRSSQEAGIRITDLDTNLEVDEFEHLYLNTKDKQGFYESLGYVEIQPIMFFANKSSGSRNSEIVKSLFKSMSINTQSVNLLENSNQTSLISSPHALGPGVPVPPPPPPTPPQNSSSMFSSKLSWYKKRIQI